MQDFKPRSTPCEQKLNFTDYAALVGDVTSTERQWAVLSI